MSAQYVYITFAPDNLCNERLPGIAFSGSLFYAKKFFMFCSFHALMFTRFAYNMKTFSKYSTFYSFEVFTFTRFVVFMITGFRHSTISSFHANEFSRLRVPASVLSISQTRLHFTRFTVLQILRFAVLHFSCFPDYTLFIFHVNIITRFHVLHVCTKNRLHFCIFLQKYLAVIYLYFKFATRYNKNIV